MAAFVIAGSLLRPIPKVVLQTRIKRAINHAMLICPNFEDTIECKLAWDVVEDLSHADRKMVPTKNQEEEMCEIDPLACREYDV